MFIVVSLCPACLLCCEHEPTTAAAIPAEAIDRNLVRCVIVLHAYVECDLLPRLNRCGSRIGLNLYRGGLGGYPRCRALLGILSRNQRGSLFIGGRIPTHGELSADDQYARYDYNGEANCSQHECT